VRHTTRLHASGLLLVSRELPRFFDPALEELARRAVGLEMTDLPNASINTMLDALLVTATVYYLGLNTANPGTTGASEVTGGSYARQAITFLAASGGSKVSGGADATQAFTGMPAEAGGIPYLSLWTASSGGTYLWGGTTTGLSGSIPSGATIDFATGAVSGSLS